MKRVKLWENQQLDLTELTASESLVTESMHELVARLMYDGTYHLSGVDVAASDTPSSTVTVGVGRLLKDGAIIDIPSAQTVNILGTVAGAWGTGSAANPTLPRYSIVCISYGTQETDAVTKVFYDPLSSSEYTKYVNTRIADYYDITVVHGLPAVSPAVPVAPDGYIKIAEILVGAGATTITSDKITMTKPTTILTVQQIKEALDSHKADMTNPHHVTAEQAGAIPAVAASVSDTHIGNRSADDTAAPTGDTGKLTQFVSWFANRIKAMTGESGWRVAPAITLKAAKAQLDDITTLKPTGATDDTDSIAAQAMIDAYNVLLLAKGTYNFTKQITVKEDTKIIGRGMDNTVINSTYNGFAFTYKSTAYTTKQSPQFMDFSLNCYSGIQLNDPTKDIADGTSANPQPYCMRGIIKNVLFNAKTVGSGVGLEMVKCFDAHVRNSNFLNFATGIHSLGSDLCSIKHNRTSGCTVPVFVESSGTFGSQMLIEHNDFLEASDCFVRSSDRFITIRNNYCERQSGNLTCFFDITGGFEAKINDNRLEGNNNTSYSLIVRQQMQLIEFNRNTCSSGINVGAGVNFTIPYKYYGYSYYYYRSIIKHEMNTVDRGFPFNYDNKLPHPYAEVFSPSREGLAADGYGSSLTVVDDGFVLGAVAPYTQPIRFNRGISRINNNLATMAVSAWQASTAYALGAIVTPAAGNGHLYICTVAGTSGAAEPTFPITSSGTVTDNTVTWKELSKTLSGTFTIKIIAKADNANQTLTVRAQNGLSTIGDTATVVIKDKQYRTYTAISSVTATDLSVALNNNNDTGNTGNIYIKAVIVEHAPPEGTLSWNPSSLADGAGETSPNITLTGAALGDYVMVAPPYDTQGLTFVGYVSAANTVNIRIQNKTGTTVDLGTGTWKVRLLK